MAAQIPPSVFKGLSLGDTEARMSELLDFVAAVLPADSLAEPRQALSTYVEARKEVNREQGDQIQAFKALEEARTEARRHYIAARKGFDAVLVVRGLWRWSVCLFCGGWRWYSHRRVYVCVELSSLCNRDERVTMV
ncbi:MAG: hypothetical protein AAFX99_17860 [Myxococcota bacterium]